MSEAPDTPISSREVDYFSVILAKGLYTNKRNLRNHLKSVFGDCNFAKKKVLEVGGGSGILSFYAAHMGADEVVCLEPEAAGSTSGVSAQFEELTKSLGLNNVSLEKTTLQAFEPGKRRFDLVLLHNSINHLDEEACIHLLSDQKAEATYRAIFQTLSALTNPGATLIVCDCSRSNLFAMLHLKNPLAPTIEWHKHQTPEVWAQLLHQEGFYNPKISWFSFNSFSGLGRCLLGNRLASYILTSQFRLQMQKKP